VLLDNGIVGERNPLSSHLGITSLVDELSYGLQVGFAVSNIRLNISEHHCGGLGDLHEHTVVDLEEAEKLHNFTGFRRDVVDTLDTDNEVEFGLGWNVENASGS